MARTLPSTLPDKLCIYPGVDIQRALRCVALYLETDNAKRVGYNSVCLFGYDTPYPTNAPDLCIYRTKTAIIVRNN